MRIRRYPTLIPQPSPLIFALNNRHTQLADRVSEWRRETCSDSLPEEGMTSPRSSESPRSIPIRSPSSGSYVPLRAIQRGRSSVSPTTPEGAPVLGGVERSLGRAPWVCSSVDATQGVSRDMLLARGRLPGSRPWTTGGVSRLASVSSVTDALDTFADAEGYDFLDKTTAAMARRTHRRRLRPQTARKSERHRAMEDVMNTSWKPVWESLQSTGLLSQNTEGVVTDSDRTPAKIARRVEANGVVRSVDIRGQRRARTARTKPRLFDSDGGGSSGNVVRDVDSDSGSASADARSVSSDGADSRTEIKRRASKFTPTTADDHNISPRPAATPTPPDCPPQALKAHDHGMGRGQQVQNEVFPPNANASEASTKVQHRKMSRQASRRSFSAMDDSSSSGEDDEEPPMGKKTKVAPEVSVDIRINRAGGGGSAGVDAGSPPPRRVSSIDAGRMLGFDLKKSLAAIDEWTHTSTATDSADTPRKEGGGGQTPPFFVKNKKRDNSPPPSSKTSAIGRSDSPTEATDITSHAKRRSSRIKKAGTVAVAGISVVNAGTDMDTLDSDDDSESEAVLSVAEARAALGISRGDAPTSNSASKPPPKAAAVAALQRHPSLAEVDAIAESEQTARGDRGTLGIGTSGSKATDRGTRRRSSKAVSGLAVGMSDEALESMLRQPPRSVPELRTKDNFRDFFRGMDAGRMSRLLRGAYEGTLSADEMDIKVEKRIGLVGDMLVW